MKLSVVMIVKNEEEMLGNCLETVKDADELIIVDTGSEDKTIEIAKQYTDKVYFFQWCDSFCKARNYANSKATGDWILTIDADEELKTSIKKVKETIEATKEEVLNIDVISKGGGDLHRQPRLYKNKEDIFWVGDIHNYLNKYATVNVDIQTVYGYSPAHKKDPDRALRILTKVVKENLESGRERYYLAREYFYRKDWVRCLWELESYFPRSKNKGEEADGYLMKARCLWQLQEGEEARKSCLTAIYLNPDFKEALLFMAEMNFEPNKSKWVRIANSAQNDGVLFVRNIRS